MSTYRVTDEDLQLLYQPSLNYLIKFEILEPRRLPYVRGKDEQGNLLALPADTIIEYIDGETKYYRVADVVIDTVEGVLQGGSYTIDANSEIRRTTTLSVTPTRFGKLKMTVRPNGAVWMDKSIHMYLGIQNLRTGEYKYYSEGFYKFSNVSANYDAQTNTLELSLVDYMSVLDGSLNGQVGALTTTIPVVAEEDPVTHKVIKKTIIRDALIAVIDQLSQIKSNNYYIEDMGESEGLLEFNKDYLSYRAEHKDWNTIPYDLKFSVGCSELDIVTQIRDLYPNVYETFFSPIDNSFNCKVIPSCIGDKCVLTNEQIQRLLISDNTNLQLNTVKNVCELWGEAFEVDFYSEHTVADSENSNTYHIFFDEASVNDKSDSTDYEKEGYKNGDIIGFRAPFDNNEGVKLRVGGLRTALPIINSSTGLSIDKDTIKAGKVYVVKIVSNGTGFDALFLGRFQVHAVTALVDGTVSNEMYICKNLLKDSKNPIVPKYSEEYFMDKYNCENVQLTIIGGSPFTVQRIGEILDAKPSDEYGKIYSDDLAMERAITENWKNCRLTDTVTITTLLIPWIDVNEKIEYQSLVQGANEPHEYIIKSITHDLDNMTSQITMVRFYPLRYKDAVNSTMGTHKSLHSYRNGSLSAYPHNMLKYMDESYEDSF